MKKIILLFAFITAGLFANAQVAATPKLDANARATKLTGTIDRVVTLTADQKAKVMNVSLERTKLMDLNREKAAANQQIYAQEKTRIIAKWNNELQVILTADQFAKLKKFREDAKNKGTVEAE